ncbi:MAG: hypothetical protein H7Y20_16570, partial [Bryobacteraceae bacterium]|nr:hypothetical protein [Bryobacteraceae bacterium]
MNNRFLRIACISLVIGRLSAAEMVLPSGTKISARLEQTISSATADAGQQVQMTVTEAVKLNGVVVIPQGAPVVGTIVLAEERKNMGRRGKLDFSVDKVRAADGEFVHLRYTMQKKEGEGKGVSTGIMTAGAAVLFWPAAPFFLMRKGKDVSINKGIVFEVFTDQDHAMTPQFVAGLGGGYQSAPIPANLTPPQPGSQIYLASQPGAVIPAGTNASVELAIVNITADIQGAEVEVDKIFIGSTPAVTKLAPGM